MSTTPPDGVKVEPFLKFPPFPEPPPGVTITPFKDFKPSGIRVRQPGQEGPELDGAGIPTVQLNVQHNSDGSVKKKKKKKKKTSAFVAEGSDGKPQQRPWWVVWEEEEHTRFMNYDLTQSQLDRLYLASNDFHDNRPWPLITTGVQNLWDTYRLYVGLLAQPIQPKTRKRNKSGQGIRVINDQVDDDDEFSDDEDMSDELAKLDAEYPEPEAFEGDQEAFEAAQTLHQEEEEAIIQADFQKRQAKADKERDKALNMFLKDPGENTRIFLSGYFRDKGLIWSDIKCRDAPLLLSFFLRYLVRSRVFTEEVDGPDFMRKLREGINVAEKAKKELPASHVIAHQLTCNFNGGCLALFDTRCKTMEDLKREFGSADDDDDATPDAKRAKLDKQEEKQFEELLHENKVEIVKAADVIDSVEAKKTAVEDNLGPDDAAQGLSNPGGWGSAPTSGAGGWGSSGWGSAPSGQVNPTPGGWATADSSAAADDPWANGSSFEEDWKIEQKSLLSVLGPTVLPLTHETGIVEWSTRRIVRVEGPEEAPISESDPAQVVEHELSRRLGKVVLEPWLGWDRFSGTDTSVPSVLPKSKGKVTMKEQPSDEAETPQEDGAHNPFKDEITLLVEPSVVEALVPGMGIGATWIQLIPQAGDTPGTGKYWYLEQAMHIIPSFHTEIYDY